MKILQIIPLLLLLSCNLEDTQQSNPENIHQPTTHEEVVKYFEETKAFISANPSIERGELPLVHGKEAGKMYDVIRLDYDKSGYTHSYEVINLRGKFIVSYKCQAWEKFCSLGFFYRDNTDPSKKWDKLMASLSDKNFGENTSNSHIINIEMLINGVHTKIHDKPDSPDDKAWNILNQMRAICLPEIPKDTVPNELTYGCICDVSRKVVTDRKK